jgi:integrase/recombinase XerD
MGTEWALWPMPKKAAFHPVKVPGRSSKWMVNVPATWSESGKRERNFFVSKEEAQTRCDQIKIKRLNYGTQVRLLTATQNEQASQALEKLSEYKGVSLNTVVEEWIARRKQAEASVPFERLMEEFADSGRRGRPRSQGYRQSIRQIQNRLTPLHGCIVSEVTPIQINAAVAWMKPSVRNYTLRVLSCAFNLGASRGYLGENPLRKVELVDVVTGEIAVHAPEEVAMMMATAEQRDPSVVPFLAISFFAGIRRSELLRLDWSNVVLNESFIRLPKGITKTKQGRHIPIERNLTLWLAPHVKTSGRIVPYSPRTLRVRESALRKIHNIATIKHGPRHAYGSYWLAKNESIDRLMLSLGHTDFETTQQHYAKAVTKRDADRFWAIDPSIASTNVVAFATP